MSNSLLIGSRTRIQLGRGPVYALAAGICLMAPFLNFLNHNDYPILRLEVGVVLLVLSAIAFAFGVCCAKLQPRPQILLCALFLAVVVPANFEGGLVLVLATIVAALLLKTRSITFAGTAFLVVLVWQAALGIVSHETDALPPMPAGDAQKPVLVHVILDAAIGIEGLPRDMPETADAATSGSRWLIENGFLVYGRAYAEHMQTVNSVPEILGFGAEGNVEKNGFGYRQATNRYMAALKQKGYAITAYQNLVTKYCGNPDVDACWTSSDYRLLSQSALSTHDKTVVLMRSFASLFDVVRFLADKYDVLLAKMPPPFRLLPPLHWQDGQVPSALGGLDALDRLAERAVEAPAGSAFFVHALIPHGPYALDASCRLKPLAEWTSRNSYFRSREDRYRAYVEQWRCALRRIGELVQSLEAARPNNDFVVVIHGDHGSRVLDVDPDTRNIEDRSPQDLRDAYSTLAAVRMPGVAAGYIEEAIPVRRVIEGLASGGFQAPLMTEGVLQPEIVLARPGTIIPGRRIAVPDLFESD